MTREHAHRLVMGTICRTGHATRMLTSKANKAGQAIVYDTGEVVIKQPDGSVTSLWVTLLTREEANRVLPAP